MYYHMYKCHPYITTFDHIRPFHPHTYTNSLSPLLPVATGFFLNFPTPPPGPHPHPPPPKKMENPESTTEESPVQKQIRLRRERREAKIKAGGSARLDKITSLTGRPLPDPAAAAAAASSPSPVKSGMYFFIKKTPTTTAPSSPFPTCSFYSVRIVLAPPSSLVLPSSFSPGRKI